MSNGFLTLVGLQTNLPNQGQNTLGPFTVNFSAVENDTVVALSSGANTITLPAGTPTGVLISPPAAGATTLILKGVTGDTGIHIAQNTPTFITFDGANLPTSFVLTAGGTVSVGIRYT